MLRGWSPEVAAHAGPRGGAARQPARRRHARPRREPVQRRATDEVGIYEEDLEAALAADARHGLTIDTLHVHLANGMLSSELPAFDAALEPVARRARHVLEAGCPPIEVNVGGGLGTPLHPGEKPLDLDAYAAILARHFGDLGVAIGVEPGEFLTNESGVLLAEVVSVEQRLGTTFVGLDAGWNVLNDRFIYDHDPELVVPARAAAPRERPMTVTGHINEGDDLFAVGYPLPEVAEGEIVAFVSVAGYSPGMWTDHCMRPQAGMVFLRRRV